MRKGKGEGQPERERGTEEELDCEREKKPEEETESDRQTDRQTDRQKAAESVWVRSRERAVGPEFEGIVCSWAVCGKSCVAWCGLGWCEWQCMLRAQ